MKHSLVYVLLILITGTGLAQPTFRYKRSISGVEKEGWYALPLPPPVFQRLAADLADLRLYALTGSDTMEVPSLIQVLQDEVTSETLQLPLFNRSTKDGRLFLTFEVPQSREVNYLDLQFNELNYFGFVAIEGSNDKREWFEIAKDQRIVSVRNGGGDYALSTVAFPIADYRFLRVVVAADIPLTFRSASFRHDRVKRGVYDDIALTWRMSSDKKLRQSFIDVRFDEPVPLSSISVQVDSAADYYRAFHIEYVRDSAKTEKGWIRYYSSLYDGFLTSFKPNEFDFAWVTAKDLRIVIRDNDNAPLQVRNVRARGPQVRVVSYLKPGVNFMLYGASDVRAPSYDLAHFETKIPEALTIAGFGAEEKILRDAPAVSPLFQNKLWLWGIMVLMIAGLGFFTIKMMKGKG